MEKYSLRADFRRFQTDVEICLSMVDAFEGLKHKSFDRSLEMLINLHGRLVSLADMCKQQTLNLIGKINPFIALNACNNLIATTKTEYIEDVNSEHISTLLQKVQTTLENLINNIKTKILSVSLLELQEPSEEIETKDQESTELTNTGNFKSLPDAAKKLLENFTEPQVNEQKDLDTLFYDKLNNQLTIERKDIQAQLDNLATNDYKIIQGSVSINQFFRADSIKDLNFSVISFDSISYNHQKKEVIPPVHVFHDQILVAIKLKPRKFYFRPTPLTPIERRNRNDKTFEQLRQEAEMEIVLSKQELLNFSNRFSSPYLVSKAFPGIRFIWFIKPSFESLLHQVKDGTVALLWER